MEPQPLSDDNPYQELGGIEWEDRETTETLDNQEMSIEFCEDVWVWISFDAVNKAFINYELGKRVQELADRLIENTTKKLGIAPQLITTDGFSSYEKPISETFKAPYVQIVKTREKGRVTEIDCNLYQGTLEDTMKAITNSDVSNTFNTSFIERFNSTIRQFNSRLRRKAYTFSKEIEKLEASLSLFQAYYNICRPHMGIKNKTPAMSCGKTNYCFTIRELLAYQIWATKEILKLPLKSQEDYVYIYKANYGFKIYNIDFDQNPKNGKQILFFSAGYISQKDNIQSIYDYYSIVDSNKCKTNEGCYVSRSIDYYTGDTIGYTGVFMYKSKYYIYSIENYSDVNINQEPKVNIVVFYKWDNKVLYDNKVKLTNVRSCCFLYNERG